MELHALVQLERVDEAILGDRPGLGQVPDRLRARLVEGVDPHQGVVVRSGRMDDPEGLLLMGVVGRGFRRHHIDQLPPTPGLLLRGGGERQSHGQTKNHCEEERENPPATLAHEHLHAEMNDRVVLVNQFSRAGPGSFQVSLL